MWVFPSNSIPKINFSLKNHQESDPRIFIYYIALIMFYGSQIITLLSSPHDREFRKMLWHHVVTIAAAIITWIMKLTIPFILIVTVFDIADILLPLCKLAGYAKFKKASDLVSLIFAVVWILTRIFFFWYWSFCFLIYFVLINGINLLNSICLVIILILITLNLVWTSFIIKMIKLRIFQKKIAHDERSDDESEEWPSLRKE